MKNITKKEWEELISSTENKKVLDVRTFPEFKEKSLENAININFLQTEKFIEEIEILDKHTTYFVYCLSGNRSSQACQVMESKGLINTYNLIGGII